MDRLYRLLAFGYLPKELPPIFNSKNFAKVIKINSNVIDDITSDKWSKPSRYLLQQRVRYRRPLAIINPNIIIQLSSTIVSNYHEILSSAKKSNLSASRPKFNRKTKFFRAVSSEFIGGQIKEKKLFLRATYPIILKCDVKNYYRSIYTHSISWSIHGKRFSKNHKRKSNLGNNLDKFVRIGQDGQTIGIPVGPDTSFIIGELILSAVDQKLGYDQNKAIRFYDDYEFGCKSAIEAEKIIDKLEKILSEFELELNHEKTKLIKGAELLEGAWTQTIKDFTRRIKVQKNEDLIDLYNIASKLAKENENDFVFKYFIRRMRMKILKEKQWGIWQNILFSAAFTEFGNLREIYEQLDLYERIGYPLNKKGLCNLLEEKAANELRGGISSELSWVIFGFLKFNIRPNREIVDKVIDKGDDISRILSIKLAIDSRIGVKRKSKELLNLLDGKSALSEHWLLFWELYINDWISDRNLKEEILKENIFEFLNQHGISFLDDAKVDLLEVPEPFRKKIEGIRGKAALDNILTEIQKKYHDLSEEGDDADFYEDEELDYDATDSENYEDY